MRMTPVSPVDGSLLRAVRSTLTSADTALLCVAFVADAGVHLVGRELEKLGANGRLLATTVFGSTSETALADASRMEVAVRTLNPSGSSTYHPKLYLGRSADSVSAVVGSANLTRGLVCNIELACHIEGSVDDEPLAKLWSWGEALWGSDDARLWTAGEEPSGHPVEMLDADLEALLRAEVARDPAFFTLGPRPSPNMVCEVSAQGLYVETTRSRGLGRPPQEIPAWMLNLAWGYLRTHGELTNAFLLKELRVHRSSAVCALLERLPGVSRARGPKIRLLWEVDESAL